MFLCSLFVREPVFVNAGASNYTSTSITSQSIGKEKGISAQQPNFGFDEISLFDDDDDDDDNEFSTSRKKIQLLRYFYNSPEFLLIHESNRSVFNPGFANNTWFPPGAKKCIFQRVIRV